MCVVGTLNCLQWHPINEPDLIWLLQHIWNVSAVGPRWSNENTNMHPKMVVDGKKKCLHWVNVTCALCLPLRCDLFKPAVPPCEVGTLTVTILLLAGSGSLVVTTFPPTEVPVIWKVCPLDVATVVSVPVPNKANTQNITTNIILLQL